MLTHYNGGHIMCHTIIEDRVNIVLLKHMFTHHLITNKAIGTIGGKPSVDKMLDLSQIIDKANRTSCGYIHSGTMIVRLLQGCNCRGRNNMCFETDKRTIDVKNNALRFIELVFYFPTKIGNKYETISF